MYAIIETSGGQYKVQVGGRLSINKIDAKPGADHVFDKVLLVADGASVSVGKPYLDGATVVATAVEQTRGEKILVFKKRRKKGYKKTQGHRQYLTELEIKDIQYKKG